jgi:WD40 repeat protein/DNA-binding SARP family transcriptional activator
MRFGVLGPLEARADDEQLTIKGAKERRLVGLLLSRANRVVAVDDIIEALWGTDPPRSAAKSVQVYVVRVRKMLEPNGRAAGDSMVSRRGVGYALSVGRGQVDALRFEDLVARAREAAAAGAYDIAAEVLREALSLWRGSAYADFQDTLFGATEAARLEEMRLASLEARIDADLVLGRHVEVTAELEALVRECPLRERFWSQLMLALYRGGRQSDALLAFRRARGSLIEEIGVEPGPELRALETAILAQDPGLAAPDPQPAGPPELPLELRRPGPTFVARDGELACLLRCWAEVEGARGAVVLVCGPAGSGRTRLAAELAHYAHARGAVVHYSSAHSEPEMKRFQPASLERSAGVRPVLVVLDDVDRASPGVSELLAGWIGAVGQLRVLIVATFDPAHANIRLDEVELRAGHAHRLALPRLGAADAALIVEHYLGAQAQQSVVESIVIRGEGLPGRLHALAAAWVEQDATQRVLDAVGQAPAARRALTDVRVRVHDGVLDLSRVRRERAAHARLGAGGGQAVLCPYKGLARFEKEDAAIFHGREALVAALVARLADTALVAVIGPSGAGKSSLVRAGLLPALAAGVLPGSGQWQQRILSPGATSRRELSRALQGSLAPAAVVIVDQFEGLFSACADEDERANFIADLLGLLERKTAAARVVLTIRADYLGSCATYPELASRIGEGTVLVAPMSDDEVRRAVEGPARYAGLDVEQDLLDAVVADVRGRPGGLPLLSTALLDTWERRRGRTLTHAGYLAAGGVSGALTRLAESAYARLAPAGQEAARRILVRLAETGEGGLPVRRRVPLEEVAPPGDEAARAALDVLVARRLLTAGDGSVEVAHEALLSHWPRLARWLEEDEQGRALRRHLAPAARDWAQSGRPDAELYRGARLASALDWAAGHTGDLNQAETEFLEASRAAADRDLREQRERADREARARRRLRVVLACVLALFVLSAAIGAAALQQRGQARAAQRSAEARRLGALALSEPDLDRSLLLAAAAVRTGPSPATEGDLLSALLRSPHALAQVRGYSRLQDLALSPDGRILAAGDNGGTVLLWDARTMRRLGGPLQVGDWSGRVAFSPDGRQLAVLSDTGTGGQVVIFDLVTRRVILRLPAPGSDTGQPGSPTWTRDGRIVAVGSGPLIFYDAATGREKGQVNVPGASTSRAVDAYPAADKVLAIAEDTRDAVLIDPKTARIVRRILLPVPASGAGVSQDGRTVAVGDATGEVFIKNLQTGKVLRGSRAHAGRVGNLVFSPDGRTAASLSADEKVIVWDVKTGKLRMTLEGHTGDILGGAFAPDGQTLYTDGLDRSVIKWDISGRRSFGVTTPGFPRIPLVPGPGIWPYVGWSADRRRAVLGYQSGLIATIDTATGRLIARDKPIKGISDLALSPDGRFAYLVSTDGTLRRWDVAARRFDKVSPLGTPEPKDVVSVSPDGRTLAVSTQSDNAVYLVDATTFQRITGPVSVAFTGVSAFSQNGQMLALGSPDGPGLAVLDVPSGRLRWANRSFAYAFSLGFSPDGRLIVAGSHDGTIATFDTQSGRRAAGPRVAHPGFVDAAAFAPGGHIILSGGTDGTVRLWDAADLRPLGQPLRVSDNAGAFATFSANGARILALDATSRITTWDATIGTWLARACSIAGHRDFTPEERTLLSITPESPRPCP